MNFKEVLKDRNVKFSIENPDDFIVVVLRNEEEKENELIEFSDYESFYKTLTPERMEILKVLFNEEVQSINHLARILSRNPKNVRNDVYILEAAGLIKLKRILNRLVPVPVADRMFISINLKNLEVRFSEEEKKEEPVEEKTEYRKLFMNQKYFEVNRGVK